MSDEQQPTTRQIVLFTVVLSFIVSVIGTVLSLGIVGPLLGAGEATGGPIQFNKPRILEKITEKITERETTERILRQDELVVKVVERPAIAAALPTLAGHAILLDVGANVDCKPRHLIQFAIMGNVYARQVLGKARPRVGLLSIGEEETKGNELTKEAFRALEEEPGIEFIGNVEGVDVFKGYADVVVCDGFTGNVALKIGESVAETIMALVREEVTADLRSRAGALLLKPAFRRLQRRLDYSEVGGAPLLGVNGITIISHGRSSAKAIRNALRVAGDCVKSRVLDNIRDGIAES
jgi:glycerol-3-phosphate acyltransferase PlsX